MKDLVAVRIVVWYVLNPEIEMTIAELSHKFGKPKEEIRKCVNALVGREFLIKEVRDVMYFKVGPELIKEIEK